MSVNEVHSSMEKFKLAALASFALGLVLFLAGLLKGETEIFLAVIIPVVKTTDAFALIGILLIFASFVLWMMGKFRDAGTDPVGAGPGRATGPGKAGGPVQTGGIILIGPIPIAFSTDRDLARILMVVAVIAAVSIMLFLIFFM